MHFNNIQFNSNSITFADLSNPLGQWFQLYAEDKDNFRKSIIQKKYQSLNRADFVEKLLHFLNHQHELHYALNQNLEEYAVCLIDLGCDLLLKDERGEIPLVCSLTHATFSAVRTGLSNALISGQCDRQSLYVYYAGLQFNVAPLNQSLFFDIVNS